jgi:lysophospholipase L1-like esterase
MLDPRSTPPASPSASPPASPFAPRDPSAWASGARLLNRWRALAACLLLALVASLAVATLAARQVGLLYEERAHMRLDPAGLSVHGPATNAALAANQRTDVVMFGDSRVVMWGPKPSLGEMHVAWRGVGGQTSAQAQGRFEQDVLALRPKKLVVSIGVNDVMAQAATGAPLTAASQVAERLARMADLARAQGIEPFVATVVRPYKPGLSKRFFWPDAPHARNRAVNEALRALHVANPKRFCLIDFDGALASSADGPLPASYASDDLHLNAAGYAALNPVLESALRKGCHGL